MRFDDESLYSEQQAKWCRHYQDATTFEPLMDDYEAGNQTFVQAALISIRWFEDWSNDAFLDVTAAPIPGSRDDPDAELPKQRNT